MLPSLRRHAAGFALLVCMNALAAQPTYDLDFGVRHDSNLTRAERADDQEDDTAVVLGSRVSGVMRLQPQDTLTGEIGMGATWWTEFSDVSELAGELGLRYRHAFGTDFQAPWLELAVAAVGLKYKDSDIRDGGLARAGLVGGRRFGMLDTRLGYTYQVRRAVEDDVFDLEQHKAFGQFDAHLGSRWLLYGEVSALEGEVVSTAGIPNPKVLRHANEVTDGADRAFGRGPSPTGIGQSVRRSYQLDAVVLNGELGINYPLRRDLALDLAANYLQAYGEDDNQYNGFGVNASLLWRFQ